MKIKFKFGEIEAESNILPQGYNECNIQSNIEGQIQAVGEQICKMIEADKKPTDDFSDNCIVGYIAKGYLKSFANGEMICLHPDARGMNNPTEVRFKTREVE